MGLSGLLNDEDRKKYPQDYVTPEPLTSSQKRFPVHSNFAFMRSTLK